MSIETGVRAANQFDSITTDAISAPSCDFAIIGPSFGTASQRIEDAFRNADSASVTTRSDMPRLVTHWYHESEYERFCGKWISRILRAMMQILRVSAKRQERVEGWITSVRFDHGRAKKDIHHWAANIGHARCLVLVKPIFLTTEELDSLRVQLAAQRVVIIVWDALWRTPTIRPLVEFVDETFSTEPSDCSIAAKISYLPLPNFRVPARMLQGDDVALGAESREEMGAESAATLATGADLKGQLFFCGSWSADRLIELAKLRRAARQYGIQTQFHLVTTNPAAALVTKMVGASPRGMPEYEYAHRAASSEVLVDLGRRHQSSPSERLDDARRYGRVLLTTNTALSVFGPPVFVVTDSVAKALATALAFAKTGKAARWWATNDVVSQHTIRDESWVEMVKGSKWSRATTVEGMHVRCSKHSNDSSEHPLRHR
jgi:hypothetical protein